MGYVYLVLGAGRQGTAAAFDLSVHGDAERIIIADLDLDRAGASCRRVNELCGKSVAAPEQADVQSDEDLMPLLSRADIAISAVPYYNNLGIARAAVAAKTSLCDLGGHTEIVFQELALHEDAKHSGVTIVPDCGMVPGLGTSVCMYAMSLVDQPEEVFLWDGGIPKRPVPPWNYILTFHFEGLINEYSGTTEFLRDGKIISVPCFEEYELIDFPEPIGQLEAFTTAGGTSSGPRTFQGRLKTYQNKTLRYKGHYQQWKTLRDAGLLDEQPVKVSGFPLRPRDLLQAVLEPQIRAKPGDEDVCIIRSRCVGFNQGKKVEAVVDLFDYYDSQTQFTSMERTTGFHIAIVATAMASKQVPPGAIPVELAVPGKTVIENCRKRGMIVTERITPLE